MVTGDMESTARAVAAELEIHELDAGISLPLRMPNGQGLCSSQLSMNMARGYPNERCKFRCMPNDFSPMMQKRMFR